MPACWHTELVSSCHADRYDWSAVQRYYDEGHGFVECAEPRFGFSHTAWVKAIQRGELRAKPARYLDRRRKYDWAAVQRFYDEGHTYRECKATVRLQLVQLVEGSPAG